MNKLSLSILSSVVGFVLGIVAGYIVLPHPDPKTSLPEVRSFYYCLDDSTIARHTIRSAEAGLVHSIDTIQLLPQVR
jgi:hypothetical protein